MGKFVELSNKGIVKYEALTDKPFEKVFALERILKFYKFQYFGQVRTSEIFYDTPNDLLNKAGLTLSKIQEDDRVFFKVCQVSDSKTALSHQKIFSHRVGVKDTLADHAFYLVDGIRGIFSSPFYIDLEHVIQNAVPKVGIFTSANVYKVMSGTGFRSFMGMEQTTYNNYETKRQQKLEGLTVKLDGPDQYMDEFIDFNDKLKKYCKSFIEVNDNLYEHVKTVTRKIDAKQARQDAKKAKEEIAMKKAEAKN